MSNDHTVPTPGPDNGPHTNPWQPSPPPEGQPAWDPGAQQGFGHRPPTPQWTPQPPPPRTGLSNVFDFSFRRFALPEAGGTIFLVAVIAILSKWLLDLVWTFSWQPDVADLLQALVGDLAVAFLAILLVRAFLEGMSALVINARNSRGPGPR